MNRLWPLSGWLLFASILASLASDLLQITPLVAGLLHWLVGLLLFSRVTRRLRMQSLLLGAVGLLALWAAAADSATLLATVFKNQAMIAMLAAVGFLRLVPLPTTAAALPQGRRAFWLTLFGIHWLGAITNLSAMVLFGDRMAGASGRLRSTQAVVLARGFGLAAIWSPFFVAMGISLSQAPAARLVVLVAWGLPLAQLLLALNAWLLGRSNAEPDLDFTGYPFTPATLTGPLMLAASVFAVHLLVPRLSIVSLVTCAAPLYTLFACRGRVPLDRFLDYLRHDLPRMGPEVVLFLAAGLLGTGVTALVGHFALTLPGSGSGPLIASLGLGAILLLAVAGIHPIAGIIAVGSVIGQVGIPPELLALSFLMSWGLGVIVSPISGTNLLLIGRFQIDFGPVWRRNVVFVAWAYLLCCAWLFLVGAWI